MKRILSLLLVILAGHGLSAQEIAQPFKDVVPPSPTVSNLMRFEEVPVNLYTGAPSISVPLFQKALNAELSLGLQLSYNTSGIRVDERSGWTGTGWSLMAGGTISRTIKDLPDEINNTGTQVGAFHNGYHDYENMTADEKDEFLWKTGAGTEKYDSQIDVFQFNFMGKTGRFSIVRNSSNNLVPILISRNERIKIEFTANTDGVISEFTLTDAKGYKYVFGTGGAYETTTSDGIFSSESQWGVASNNGNFSSPPAVSRSAWHLTSVKLPNDTELCNLTYQSVTESYNTPESRKSNHPTSLSGPDFGSTSAGSYNKGVLLPRSISSNSSISVTTYKLRQINFRDGTDILLDRVAGHPEMGGGSQLSKVSLRDEDDNTLQYYDFTYATTSNDRLFLTDLSHKAGSESQDYTFHYDDRNGLPEFGSSQKDQWGYFNDENNESTFTNPHFAKYADVTEVTTGVLTKIDYPTGGSKEFDYESNRFSFIGDEEIDPMLIPENSTSKVMDKTVTTTGTTSSTPRLIYVNHDHTATLTQSGHSLGSAILIDNHRIEFEAVTKISGTYSTDPNSDQVVNLSDFQADSSRPDPLLEIVDTGSENKQNVSLATGWYLIRIINSTPYIPGPGTINISIDLELAFREYSLLQEYMNGAGIRIKEIRFTEDGTTQSSTKYTYDEPDDAGVSSGSFDGLLFKDKTYEIDREHMFVNGNVYVVNTLTYEVDEERNALYTSADKSHFIGYKHVRKEQTGNGYTDYTLSSARDYPSFGSTYAYPFAPVEDQSFKTSLTLKEKVMNNGGDSLLVKTNDYTYSSENVVRSINMFQNQFESCGWNALYNDYDAYDDRLPENNPANLQATPQLNCGSPSSYMGGIGFWEVGTRADLTETNQTEYFPTQSSLEKSSRQTFVYNSDNWQISQQNNFMEEGGTEYQYSTYFYYPHSYPSEYYNSTEQTALGNMITYDNKYNELVATKSTKNEVGGPLVTDALSIVVNKYSSSGSSNYRLKTYQVAQTPGTAASLEDRFEVVSYDTYGNPLEVKPTDGAPIAYAWGYSGTVPVIQVQDMTQTDLSTAITWAIANTAGLPQGTTTLQHLLDHVGDMTTASERSSWAAFNAKLKEHSLMAYKQATTMTYHRVYGMTSQTAANGLVSYYEYDAYGRLIYVKDQDGNILKMNEYTYQATASSTGN